ncbi:DUF1611 domain-containing protein [Kordiimonas marina]|uniref:DUF1611 domain-containing protein n=1 Tax=Kordiimonas marina TaxID=2872312 RepID=UPI001FF28137|nr:DUF1611 domain-containing protein [Kordiimonas marina]MCJ9427975.1 DUF1611 domain-containing protein [Kordiimonas marina]
MDTITLKGPYLIFLGRETRQAFAKTGLGLVEWRRDLCLGQLRLPGGIADLGVPDMTLGEAVKRGVGSLVIGTAAIGGKVPDEWVAVLLEAAGLGLDIVAGLHSSLSAVEGLPEAAEESGARLVNVRIPPVHLPVGSGKKRSGKRVLMVGTDCAVGKKYTALQLEKDMKAQGLNATFRASGQTGIMIAGSGIPIDAVVSDFVVGAAELLSPANAEDHWDVIEGQGGIFHPAYAPVSLGLLLGSQPDAFVVCHDAGRETISGWEHMPVPEISQVIDRTVALGSLTNPAIECVGISVNTAHLSDDERAAYLDDLSRRHGLPCVDPLKNGTGSIIARLTTLNEKQSASA